MKQIPNKNKDLIVLYLFLGVWSISKAKPLDSFVPDSWTTLCWHAGWGAPPRGRHAQRRDSSPPSAELGALSPPFCGQLSRLDIQNWRRVSVQPSPTIYFPAYSDISGPHSSAIHPLPERNVGAASSRMGNRDDEYDFLFKGKREAVGVGGWEKKPPRWLHFPLYTGYNGRRYAVKMPINLTPRHILTGKYPFIKEAGWWGVSLPSLTLAGW